MYICIYCTSCILHNEGSSDSSCRLISREILKSKTLITESHIYN